MNVTQLSTTQGGAVGPLQRQVLQAPVATSTTPVFRSTRYLRLPTGGLAESIVLGIGPALRGTFVRYDYDAVTVSETSLRAERSAAHGGVVVTLDAPRRILSIDIASAKAAPGQTLELYRLDGDAPATEPTVTATRQSLGTVAQKSSGQSAAGSGGSSVASASSGGSGGSGGEVIFALTGSGGSGSGAGSQEFFFLDDLAALGTTGPFDVDFTDTRFLVRLKGSGGASVSLGGNDVQTVVVRSYPRNPRVGLALPAEPGAPTVLTPENASFFWRAEGEVGNGLPTSAGTVNAGAAFAEELTRGLDRLASLIADLAEEGLPPPTLPQNLDIALVFESDAPCALDPPTSAAGPALNLPYSLVRSSFTDGSDKQVLRFDAGRVSSQGFTIDLPAGATIEEATMEVDLSLPSSATGGSATTLAESELATADAVRLTTGRWAAQPIVVPEALTITGIALGLMGLVPRSEVTVELRADGATAAEARQIAAVTQPLPAPGRRAWYLFRFPSPIVISTAPHWLVVGPASGSAVWLAIAGTGALNVVNRAVDGVETPHSRLTGFGGMYSLLALGGGTTNGGGAQLPAAVFVAGASAALTATEGTRAIIDMTAGLNAALASAGDGPTVPAQIAVEAVGSGVVTAYPPRIVYG